MHRIKVLLAALLGTIAAGVAAAPAQAETRWLCRPGQEQSPCAGDLTTTVTAPDGTTRVEPVAVPADPPVDCFYVYPTVSNQPTRNATATPDPEVRSIAVFQAQRFSTRCRVYAPLYREVTAAGVTVSSNTKDTAGYDEAYGDVRAAWRAYLRDDNGGRGVVLVGHSQGSRMLRALLRREIDPDPAQRALLVSAVIPGANFTVARGRRTGGDLQHVPACDRGDQPGCVIAYSTFNATPPDNARFGRTDTDPVGAALGLPVGGDTEVLCTSPSALAGHGEAFGSLVPTQPFAPGIIAALLLKLYGGPPPAADTPWLVPRDHYAGRCERAGGANVLMIRPVAGARTLSPSPDATWGTHLVDLNLPLQDLLDVVGRQTAAFLDARRPFAVALSARRAGPRARRLTARVTGPAGAHVRVALERAGRVVLRRSVTLGPDGVGRVTFTVHRAGRYRVGAPAPSPTVRLSLR